jgi:hypothetical protein
MTALSKLEREAAQILARLRRLEEIPVQSAAKLLKKSPEWVRLNLPVIVHGPKSHHVRAVDIEAYQEKRTIYPLSLSTIRRAA